MLTRQQTRALYRAVLILDAVIRQKDHGAASLKAWLGGRTQPLKILVFQQRADFPELDKFFEANKNSGIRLSMEQFISELANLWSTRIVGRLDSSQVRDLFSIYIPVAIQLGMHEPMQQVFKEVRSVVKEMIVST